MVDREDLPGFLGGMAGLASSRMIRDTQQPSTSGSELRGPQAIGVGQTAFAGCSLTWQGSSPIRWAVPGWLSNAGPAVSRPAFH